MPWCAHAAQLWAVYPSPWMGPACHLPSRNRQNLVDYHPWHKCCNVHHRGCHFGLDPVKQRKDLQLWSSHSLCLDVCLVLHTHGFRETNPIPTTLEIRGVYGLPPQFWLFGHVTECCPVRLMQHTKPFRKQIGAEHASNFPSFPTELHYFFLLFFSSCPLLMRWPSFSLAPSCFPTL